MNKILFLAGCILAAPALADGSSKNLGPYKTDHYQMAQGRQTSTYVRCWYRLSQSHNDTDADWEWAREQDGRYYQIQGYWRSSVSLKNMFYTNTPQTDIEQRCRETLGVTHDTADIMYYASDTQMSYNHSIWTNDGTRNDKINRIITFGDSLSDTGNLYNASQWVFPNRSSWYLGHFSNGFVWTEYLAKHKQLPLYNWAVGGAAGVNQYGVLTGVYNQVTSYLKYMDKAENYNPKNSLVTLAFGLNDLMNYHRLVADVKADLSSAIIRLTESGVTNILLFTLPDATKAPQFKYSTIDEIRSVRANIIELNTFIKEQAELYQSKGLNVILYDAHAIFDQITTNPELYGFENATDACLNINRNSPADYLQSHVLTNDCAYYGSDKYVFWGVTHPTTATHKYIADDIIQTKLDQFNF
ncbi:thermolabile hemolysin [Vibrio zhanjiangensis]|uniref:Thermolabile hemolysin n=1 Tax=Vibrio zhanjiangensis TaxID=1046128 RepID=A0ABQ6EUV0_9VIBR|nr:SGNH/GDSL hydrolase family protein [Vibrio zhanjiangensis]GLT16945.1 thermolabile hemolysin [Vibrio zhanjiangensis]